MKVSQSLDSYLNWVSLYLNDINIRLILQYQTLDFVQSFCFRSLSYRKYFFSILRTLIPDRSSKKACIFVDRTPRQSLYIKGARPVEELSKEILDELEEEIRKAAPPVQTSCPMEVTVSPLIRDRLHVDVLETRIESPCKVRTSFRFCVVQSDQSDKYSRVSVIRLSVVSPTRLYVQLL